MGLRNQKNKPQVSSHVQKQSLAQNVDPKANALQTTPENTWGNGATDAQAEQIQRMSGPQQQLLLRQISQTQGNRHIQRLVGAIGQTKPSTGTVQRTPQTGGAASLPPSTATPDYHIAIMGDGTAKLVADPSSLKKGSVTGPALHPKKNRVGPQSQVRVDDDRPVMHEYTTTKKGVAEQNDWYPSLNQNTMHQSFNTSTKNDKNIDIYVYKYIKKSASWKAVAHIDLEPKKQGNIHEVIKQLNRDRLSKNDLTAVMPLLQVIPGAGTKKGYSNADMIKDARSSDIVGDAVKQIPKGLMAGLHKGKYVSKDNASDNRHEFMQYMGALLGGQDKAAEHFSKIREVKDQKGIFLHESAAQAYESVRAKLAKNKQPLPSASCGLGLRGRFHVNNAQSPGKMMHPLGYAMDFYVKQNPMVTKDGGKNDTWHFINIMAQEMGEKAGPAHLQLSGQYNQYTMVDKMYKGTASDKERAGFLQHLESEMLRLSQASANFQRLISVEDSKKLKNVRTQYISKLAAWNKEIKTLKNGKKGVSGIKQHQYQLNKLEKSQAYWVKQRAALVKKKDANPNATYLDKKITNADNKLETITNKKAPHLKAIEEKQKRIAEINQERADHEAQIKAQVRSIIEPVAEVVSNALEKFEQKDEATWLRGITTAEEALKELKTKRAQEENALETIPTREIAGFIYDEESGEYKLQYKEAKATETKEDRLAHLDKEIEKAGKEIQQLQEAVNSEITQVNTDIAKAKKAGKWTQYKELKKKAALHQEWSAIRRIKKAVSTDIDLHFTVNTGSTYVNPSVISLLNNGFFTIAETATNQPIAADNDAQKDETKQENEGEQEEKPVKKGLREEGYSTAGSSISGFGIDFFKEMTQHGFTLGGAWEGPDSMHFDFNPGRRKLPKNKTAIKELMKPVKQKVHTADKK